MSDITPGKEDSTPAFPPLPGDEVSKLGKRARESRFWNEYTETLPRDELAAGRCPILAQGRHADKG